MTSIVVFSLIARSTSSTVRAVRRSTSADVTGAIGDANLAPCNALAAVELGERNAGVDKPAEAKASANPRCPSRRGCRSCCSRAAATMPFAARETCSCRPAGCRRTQSWRRARPCRSTSRPWTETGWLCRSLFASNLNASTSDESFVTASCSDWSDLFRAFEQVARPRRDRHQLVHRILDRNTGDQTRAGLDACHTPA